MLKGLLAPPPNSSPNPILASFDDKFFFSIATREEGRGKTDVYNIAKDTWIEGPKMADPGEVPSTV